MHVMIMGVGIRVQHVYTQVETQVHTHGCEHVYTDVHTHVCADTDLSYQPRPRHLSS